METIRDLKGFTSKKIHETLHNSKTESRKEWMLRAFRYAGKKNSNNKHFQLWRQDNHPIELFTPKVVRQKIKYIHENPVKAGIVSSPEHYLYSSAIDYYTEQCGMLDVIVI
ncbi:transposase [Fulvitalea axinellae]